MAYNQMLQSTIEGVKAIARTDLCIMDTDGNVIASTVNTAEDYKDSVLAFVESPAEIQVVSGYQYFKIFDGGQLEYIMLIRGDSDDIYTIGKLVAFQIQNLLSAYLTKRILLKMSFWIICCLWTFITRQKNYILPQKHGALFL